MTTTVNRNWASAVGRLVKIPQFDLSALQPGDNVIFADDHAQSGGFFCTVISYTPDNVNIMGIAALTRHPLTHSLLPASEILKLYHKIPNIQKINATLTHFGITPNCMTNRELLTIIAVLSPSLRKNEIMTLMKNIGNDPKISSIENQNDSIEALLTKPQISPLQLIQEMNGHIPTQLKEIS